MINRLSDFGHNFQVKSVGLYLSDKEFLATIQDILDFDCYESESMRWIVKQCKEYFDQYKNTITLDVFKVKVQDIKSEVLKTTVVEDLKQIHRALGAEDLDYIKDNLIEFFRNQKLKVAIMDSVNILETSGDYDKIQTIIDQALNSGMEKNVGHDYLADIQERYEDSARITCETPWPVCNELLQGGLGCGELGVIVAPAGVGKSWVLSKIGSEAIREGKKVVHYTLELNEYYVGLRYDSIFTGIPASNLKFHKEEVVRKLAGMKGNLVVKYFPTKTASVNTITAHLQKMKTLGHEIDCVIVDYADIMKDRGYNKEVRHALGNIYEDLRGLAGEIEVPVWTASQANRSALDEDVIEAQKVAESYSKVMTADFVMSLSRKVEDKVANTGRFHIIKNRFGPDGLTYPAKVNTNTGQIEIYESNTISGKEQQNKIDNRDQLQRKMLANRYSDLIGKMDN